MQEQPLVSAVITTHNRLELLKRAIDSVMEQTYSNIECIVVSDNSTDGTNEYCESRKGIRLIAIPKHESRGGNYARNLGIKAANGEYIAFLDDDDYWLPEKTEMQMDLIEAKKCEMVSCLRDLEYVMPDGNVQIAHNIFPAVFDGDMSKIILYQIYTTTTLMLVKKQALLDIGLFDEDLKFWQEYELCIRLAQRAPFFCHNKSLAVYRIDKCDKGRLTNKYREWKKAVSYIRQKHVHLYKELNHLERYFASMLYVVEAMDRSFTAGCRRDNLLYKFLLNTYFIPARIILKYRRMRDEKQFLLEWKNK